MKPIRLSIGCSGGDRLRRGLKCVGGGTERAGCAVGEDMSTLLLTTNEQTLAELQVELSRRWEEGLQKPSLGQREAAWIPNAGCFTALRAGWTPQCCGCLTSQDSLYCWREKRSLVAVVPPHYSVWVHFELIVANNGHPTGLGREEGNQAYVSVVWQAA